MAEEIVNGGEKKRVDRRPTGPRRPVGEPLSGEKVHRVPVIIPRIKKTKILIESDAETYDKEPKEKGEKKDPKEGFFHF